MGHAFLSCPEGRILTRSGRCCEDADFLRQVVSFSMAGERLSGYAKIEREFRDQMDHHGF
jgi:hypothetical protein